MKALELSPRLAMVARCVPEGCRLADVGTDHAYLPAWLLQNGKIRAAVASDLREGPLGRARETARRYGLCEGQLRFCLCDGLRGIGPEEVDAIAIAGMGGETIAGILAAAPWAHGRRLILQPMTSLPELRQWLQQNGYQICTEHVAQEQGTLYAALTAIGGSMPPMTPGEAWAGRRTCWAEEPQRGAYLAHLLSRAGRELAGAERSRKPEDRSRSEVLAQVIGELTTWKGEWDYAQHRTDL